MKAKPAHINALKHRLMALIFGAALLVPSLVQLEHILDGHSHLGCSQNTTHLHELDHGCDLLAFHLGAASLAFSGAETPTYCAVYPVHNFWLIDLPTNQLRSTKTSRGPPTLI